MSKTVIRYWHTIIPALTLMAIWPFQALADSGARLFDVHLTAQGSSTQVSLGLNRPMAFRAAVDSQADRVTIDFDDMTQIPGRTIARGLGLIRSFHAEPLPHGGVRLVLDLARPAVIAAVHAASEGPGKTAQAIVDLVASNAPAMREASGIVYRPKGDFAQKAASIATDAIGALIAPSGPRVPVPISPQLEPKPETAPAPASAQPETRAAALIPVANLTRPAAPSIAAIISPKRTIVIDAGHGGIDPGAESVAGYHEKEITLATARLLRRALEQTGRYKVVLTRDSDVYLKLHERVARARAAHGDLFISLHADSVVNDRATRGASIYTLSETASDAESDRYAQRENRADAIGGVDLGDQSDDVAGILVDLTVRETVNDGNRLAGMMVDALEHQGVSLLPSAPHRSAGFAVLKSPDIPSVLIEMGYLSDISDARALADPRHQAQIANAITDGVDRYFAWLQVSRS